MSILDQLRAQRVLPLLVLDDEADAVPTVQALASSGLWVVELALRTPAALRAVEEVAKIPGVQVGVGTVTSAAQVDDAVSAGATFIISPGMCPAVVRACQVLETPVIPGVATASEIQAAMRLGISTVKFFPAAQLGGVPHLDALSGAFPDIQFLPTGGITAMTAGTYLQHPAVVAVGGSWMAPRNLIRIGNFQQISHLAHTAVRMCR